MTTCRPAEKLKLTNFKWRGEILKGIFNHPAQGRLDGAGWFLGIDLMPAEAGFDGDLRYLPQACAMGLSSFAAARLACRRAQTKVRCAGEG
jgi:hypothetical protein